MKFETFIVRKIAFSNRNSFSRFIINIAVTAISLSIAVMIITTSLVTGFQDVIKNKVYGFWAHINVMPYSMTESASEQAVFINQAFYQNQQNIDGVDHIQAVALKGGIMKTRDNFDGVVLKGVGKDFSWERFMPFLKEGSRLSLADDSINVKEIIISQTTARRLMLKIGDPLIINFMDKRVRMKKFKIAGLYSTGIDEFDKEYALCNISLIQQLNGWGTDSAGSFEVFTTHVENIDQTAENVFNQITDPYLEVRSIYDVRPNIFDWLKLQQTNEMVVLIIMAIVAVINMITALLILILERTNMVGILKALGATNLQLIRVFIINASLIILLGICLGNLIGFGLCLLQQKFGFITLSEESYYVSVAPIVFHWPWLIAINLGTFLLCTMAMLLPALLVIKIVPVKAIRFK